MSQNYNGLNSTNSTTYGVMQLSLVYMLKIRLIPQKYREIPENLEDPVNSDDRPHFPSENHEPAQNIQAEFSNITNQNPSNARKSPNRPMISHACVSAPVS